MEQKIALYARVSTEEQAKEGISVQAQIDRCKAYCESRAWKIHKVYKDAGFSAGTTKRPAFQELLEDARGGKFTTVLVYKIDRFSRNLKDLILILEDLKEKNINFTSVTEQIDTTTAMGEAFFQIIGVFAQLERGMVKERVEMAFDKKISGGEALSRAPYGYKYRNGQLVIDEEAAARVRKLFSLRSQGATLKSLSEQFSLPVSTVYDILKNPVYTGKIRYKGQIHEGKHEPIISEGLFESINS